MHLQVGPGSVQPPPFAETSLPVSPFQPVDNSPWIALSQVASTFQRCSIHHRLTLFSSLSGGRFSQARSRTEVSRLQPQCRPSLRASQASSVFDGVLPRVSSTLFHWILPSRPHAPQYWGNICPQEPLPEQQLLQKGPPQKNHKLCIFTLEIITNWI